MTLEELQKQNLKLIKSRTYFRKGKQRISLLFRNKFDNFSYRLTFGNDDEEIWPIIKKVYLPKTS